MEEQAPGTRHLSYSTLSTAARLGLEQPFLIDLEFWINRHPCQFRRFQGQPASAKSPSRTLRSLRLVRRLPFTVRPYRLLALESASFQRRDTSRPHGHSRVVGVVVAGSISAASDDAARKRGQMGRDNATTKRSSAQPPSRCPQTTSVPFLRHNGFADRSE